MSKIYFKHGVMSSGKTANLLMTDFTYRDNGVETLLLKPSLDKRSSEIKSRIGLKAKCLSFDKNHSIKDLVNELDLTRLKVILIDESQFLSKAQAIDLAVISHTKDIDIICYGLMLDYKGNIFEGSKALIEVGAKLEEIKSCGKQRLTHHLRYVNGEVVFSGDVIASDCKEVYQSVDFKTFLNAIK